MSFRPRHLLIAGLSGALAWGTLPAAADCGWVSVTATAVDFHRYRPRDPSPTDAVGHLQVQCSGFGTDSTAYEVAIDSGTGGDSGARQMTGDGGALAYDLFLDPARTRSWGSYDDGTSPLRGEVDAGRPEGDIHPVYGRIFPRQNVPPGDYSDQVTITVFF